MGGVRSQNSETPEPVNIKFGTDVHVGDITRHAQVNWGRPGTSVKYLSRGFYFFSFFVTQNFAHFPRPSRRAYIYAD